MNTNNLLKAGLLIALVSTLSARSNPFVPTQTYIEEKESLVDPGEIIEPYNPSDRGRTIKIMPQEEPIQEIVVKKEPVIIEEVPAVVEPKLVLAIKETKKIEEIIFKEVSHDCNTSKVAVVPKEIKIYKYNLLDFVNIDITDDTMNIETDYKLKQQFILENENKIVFDFIGKKNFYTKRETLSSHEDFKKIVIGAHPENKYFRVVIQTQLDLKEYKINIDENELITVNKIVKEKVSK